MDVEDDCFDIEGIISALKKARAATEKPTFINVRTVIGVGSKLAGDARSHGPALGEIDVANMKRAADFDSEAHFFIPEDVRRFFADLPARGEGFVEDWNQDLVRYRQAYPALAEQFDDRRQGRLPFDWQSLIPSASGSQCRLDIVNGES